MALRRGGLITALIITSLLLAGCASASAPDASPAQPSGPAPTYVPGHVGDTGPIVDFGGEIVPNATVRVVYWGFTPTDPNYTTLYDKISQSYPDVLASSYMNVVDEYMRGAGHSYTFAEYRFTSGISGPGHTPGLSGVGTAVRNVYGTAMLNWGPSITVVIGNNYSSYPAACGWHDTYKWRWNNADYFFPVIYIPNNGLNANSGCLPYGNPAGLFAATTIIGFHEIVETAASKFPCSATLTYCDSSAGVGWAKADDYVWENADICASQSSSFVMPSGVRVALQPSWSNDLNGCWYGGLTP